MIGVKVLEFGITAILEMKMVDFDVWLKQWLDDCYTILARVKTILDKAGV